MLASGLPTQGGVPEGRLPPGHLWITADVAVATARWRASLSASPVHPGPRSVALPLFRLLARRRMARITPRRVSLVVTAADKGSGQEPALPLDTSWPSRRRLVFQNHLSFTRLSGSLRSFRCTLIDVEESPVSRALMSGLLRGACRWPSWVFACVPGTILQSVLEAHMPQRSLVSGSLSPDRP